MSYSFKYPPEVTNLEELRKWVEDELRIISLDSSEVEERIVDLETDEGGVPPVLTADLDYYVDPASGSDSNDGLTVGAPKQTLQAAWDAGAQFLLGGFRININLADGTYTSGIRDFGSQIVGGHVSVSGNLASPQNVILNCSLTDCIEISGSFVILSGMELRNTVNSGIHTYFQGHVTIGPSMRFGACAEAHVFVDNEGQVVASNSYSIVGNAPIHWFAHTGGWISVVTRTVTVVGSLTFSSGFAYALRGGEIEAADNTYVNAIGATGNRVILENSGVIYLGANDISDLPGDVDGLLRSGFLNDVLYAENYDQKGTFVPVVAFGGASTGITYGTQEGEWQRNDDWVNFRLRVDLTNNGSATGSATVTGLPYSARNVTAVSVWVDNINTTAGACVQALIEASATEVKLYEAASGFAAGLDETYLTNTAFLLISGQYTTDDP